MKQDELLPIKTPLQELELLAKLGDSNEFIALKRAARRYAENLKNLSFTLKEEDPHFAIKHTRYVEQVMGMQILLRIVEDAKKELNKLEEAG